ncbi:MAG: hypothetical protein JETT_2826 [Candidatus Jettenia ecosi]|uniref:Uncharacterized protein n=1 Tax=Candidatus Jettenia ecosi TaxID=2494326 RepID=A0A533Q8B5_9BACT|nr:MAG: hypothetical protein JETT_2826 [Candidatus Jettenia ecosi]
MDAIANSYLVKYFCTGILIPLIPLDPPLEKGGTRDFPLL